MNDIPSITLNDERAIPQLGFGVFEIAPDDTAATVREALDAGYLHIDTAQMYDNERGVGEGIRASGLERDSVYVTSKLHIKFHRPDHVRRAFDDTLSALGFEYVDLFLIHWPMPTSYGGYVSTWQAFEEFQRDGRARSIGVSNFEIGHLERLAAETDTVPAVNQIEAHPCFPNDTVRAYGREHGIVTEAWAPLARGTALSNPVIVEIATRLGRTPSQIMLRWHIQRGDVVFPKTLSPARMTENLDVFSFELGPEDMAAVSALQQGEAGRIGSHPDSVDWIPGRLAS